MLIWSVTKFWKQWNSEVMLELLCKEVLCYEVSCSVGVPACIHSPKNKQICILGLLVILNILWMWALLYIIVCLIYFVALWLPGNPSKMNLCSDSWPLFDPEQDESGMENINIEQNQCGSTVIWLFEQNMSHSSPKFPFCCLAQRLFPSRRVFPWHYFFPLIFAQESCCAVSQKT